MRLSVSAKLFLSFLLVTVLVLLATLTLARWSFERGFLDYVNALEQNRLERVAEALAEEYVELGGSWSGLSDRRFNALLRQSRPDNARQGPGPGSHPGQGIRPEGLRSPRHRPPPHFSSNDRPPEDGPPRGPPLKWPRRPGSGAPATSLFDPQGKRLAGTELQALSVDLIRVPVIVREQLVAELRTVPRRTLSSPQETRFSREQFLTSLWIGGLSLAVAALVSLLLARTLLAPLRKTISYVRGLANGDFETRLLDARADELGDLMSNVDRLSITLAENRTSRRRWLADISHELRTPIAILAGEIEALRDGVRQFDAASLGSLEQEVGRLRSLVDDLYQLSLSDLGGLRYEFVPLDLGAAVAEGAALLISKAETQGLAMDVVTAPGCFVSADRNRILQLLTNLLQNAIAYTDSPGKIRLVVERAESNILLSVDDTAPGADAETLRHLFEPLYRADKSRTRNVAGAGLGLAICQNVVAAHSATIEAAPSSLGGLRLLVTFPPADSLEEAPL